MRLFKLRSCSESGKQKTHSREENFERKRTDKGNVPEWTHAELHKDHSHNESKHSETASDPRRQQCHRPASHNNKQTGIKTRPTTDSHKNGARLDEENTTTNREANYTHQDHWRMPSSISGTLIACQPTQPTKTNRQPPKDMAARPSCSSFCYSN